MNVEQMNTDPDYLRSQHLSPTFPERFISKVLKTDTHWLWQGSTRPCGKAWPKGHGMIQRSEGINSKIYAHRAAWILFRGPIPDGKMVLHVCPGGANPQCVNPTHLALGDQFENMSQMTAEGKNHFSTHSFKGEESPQAKLTWEIVREIRAKRKAGITLARLASEYPVSIGQLSHICRNHCWIE